MKIEIECTPQEFKSLFNREQHTKSENEYSFRVTNGLTLVTALNTIKEMESRGEIKGKIRIDCGDIGIY